MNAKTLRARLEAALQDRFREEGAKQRRGLFYASDVGRCVRALALDFYGAEKNDVPPHSIIRMRRGKQAHDDFEEVVKRAFPEAQTEHRWEAPAFFEDEAGISGRSDVLMLADGWGIEFKQVSTVAFRQAGLAPQERHVRQAQLYMKYYGISKWFIFYEAAETGEWRVQEIEYDPKAADEIWEEWKPVWEALKAGTLPPRPYEKSSAYCKRCEYRNVCWSDWEPEGPADLSYREREEDA